jgi:Fic family protein
MFNAGYRLAEFVSVSAMLRPAPSRYAMAFLDTEQDSGDLTHFFVHQLGVLRWAVAELRAHLDRTDRDERRTLAVLQARPGEYNPRQVVLMDAALADPTTRFTAQGVAGRFGVTLQTARADLGDLTDRGLLVFSRASRQHVWTPAPDLAARLAGTV